MSRRLRAGLIVLGVLSVLDLLSPLLTDGEHPPMSIALIGSAIGAISLACVAFAWRGSRRAVTGLVVLRLLSAVSAVPAFFVEDVPAGVSAIAAAGVAATVVGVVLCFSGVRRTSMAVAS